MEKTAAYIDSCLGRLGRNGYRIVTPESLPPHIRAVAHRSRIELTKFGFCESFVVFGAAESSIESVRAFSHEAFSWAMANRSHGLPPGLFEAVYCFAVALVPEIDETTASRLKTETPARHWSAAEIPLAYDESRRALHYFDRTPLWGFAYYSGFRKTIRTMLLSSEPAP